MTRSILLIGVGGQGTILISKILSAGFARMGYDVKMSEIHGMSQRGGSVTTMIRYGDEVHSPNFGEAEADVIISFEKSEALRALPQLKKGGTVITDSYEIYPVPVLTGAATYPSDALDQLKAAVPNTIVIEAFKAAERLGNSRCQNIVLLGKLVRTMGLDEKTDWISLVAANVPPATVDINLKAYDLGYGM